MGSKTIKISEENYKWLLKVASDLQREYEKPVSFDEALGELKDKKKSKGGNLMSLAGRWKMTDKEAKEFLNGGKKGWKNWKIPSV